MKPYKRLGQLIMVGVDGTEPTFELISYLKEYNFSGIVLFRRNIVSLEQVGYFVGEIRDKIPGIFVAVDEEGGTVSRYRGICTDLPGNQALGNYFKKTGDLVLIEQTAELMARELKLLGVTWNFAPVFDLNSNPNNPVIGDRSYSPDFSTVIRLGSIFIKTFQSNGIMATAKHFPGHGDTSIDSHESLPIIQHGLERLAEVELKPFIGAIEANVASIMSAHIKIPSIDSQFPCTLSPLFMTQLLRKQLKYKGIIITDDLEMGAVVKNYHLDMACYQSLKAGCDMIMICTKKENQEVAIKNLVNALEKNYISKEQIEKKYQKIMHFKKSYLKEPFKFDLNLAKQELRKEENLKIAEQLSKYK